MTSISWRAPIRCLLVLVAAQLSGCSVLEGNSLALPLMDPLVLPGYLGPAVELDFTYIAPESEIKTVLSGRQIEGADWLDREGGSGGVGLADSLHILRISGYGSGTLTWSVATVGDPDSPIHSETFAEPPASASSSGGQSAVLGKTVDGFDLAVDMNGVTVHFDIFDGP